MAAANVIFYDGDCALCHGFVRFLLGRDAASKRFVFSPLGGRLITQLLTPAERAGLPDSLVLRTGDGRLRVRSEAVLGSFEILGGFWAGLAAVCRLVPVGVRDAVYDLIARSRRAVFGTTSFACPLVPANLRDRFVD
ncbi:MAG TPA: DCC1-like thiol-disulfide oxidoreductase family protein [Candidatus Acidoferrales bacterium]|nr:DCC1-like thiol-disulfide oxidoreductase family protein [Candidatus Acidoferrales bacterium]